MQFAENIANYHFMQLRHKVFLALTLLTAVPLLILLFGVVDRMETEIRTRTNKELHVTLDKMADEVNLILENQKSIARGLAHVPSVRQFSALISRPSNTQGQVSEYQRRAEELETFFLNYAKALPSIQALRFIDSNGKTLVKVKEGKPVEPKIFDPAYKRYYITDQSNKSFYKYTVGIEKEVVMSDFELGQVTEEADFCPAMVRYSARIRDEVEHNEGMIVVNMWGTRLDSTVEASLGGYPGNAYIVEVNDDPERDGIYLYHRDTAKRFGNQLKTQHRFTHDVSAAEWQRIKSMTRGSLFRDDGRMLFYRMIAPFETRPSTHWILMIDIDSEAVFAPVEAMRQSIWFLLGVLLVISLLISVWASWQLSQPVYDLANVITRYADGDQSVRYLDRRQDEIGIAGKAFNYLATSLQKAEQERDKAEKLARQSERLASVGQLAAGIGHEINNPLMNIMSLASLIESEVKNNDELVGDIRLLQKEGQRCARIVQGILSFARENKPDYKEFNISELIEETLRLLAHRIESAEITVVSDLQPNLYLIGDPNQLQQVLVNVILNAVQASPENATIHIKSYKDIDYIAVEILDRGTGIKSENLSKVFDPFFTTKSEGEGTGLGLSVSYGIVKHHGGTIHMENTPNSGLRVVILLPFHAQSIEHTEQKKPEKQHVV